VGRLLQPGVGLVQHLLAYLKEHLARFHRYLFSSSPMSHPAYPPRHYRPRPHPSREGVVGRAPEVPDDR
jgi:hypothetical protein